MTRQFLKDFLPVSAFCIATAVVLAVAPSAAFGQTADSQFDRLATALLGATPLESDLHELTDRIGGRATGSAPNLRSVDWALDRFRAAGVTARKEAFQMPSRWLERSARSTISGAGLSFSPRIAAMPFSVATPIAGVSAPLVDGGRGSVADFAKLGTKARGAFVLIEQDELKDIDGLFAEYALTAQIEPRAFDAGVAGVVYIGSRANSLLYRHNVSIGTKNTRPMVVMERDGGLRALRLLRDGTPLSLTEKLDLDTGGPYESYNVIGEIPGTTKADEIVLIGAHLDSWDLGDGALDNGANVAMLIDVARQFQRLGIRPARTIRFALWNGEEQGMEGSFGYARSHESELDRHVMVTAFDIGCGRVDGFFTGGRPALIPLVDKAMKPVEGLGPFTTSDVPIVGTDNFDFMLHGIANIVANQESATYGPNYHARSDTYEKCDTRVLRQNAIVSAALVYGFAMMPEALPRQSRAEIDALMKATDLPDQMKSMGVWDGWAAGTRGRKK
ncbi:MAG: M20/M25/M40 family metallo-hydrolase [Gemmatimonadaceae bacterium]